MSNVVETSCAAACTFYRADTGKRTDFVEAWWSAWAHAAVKADQTAAQTFGVQQRPVGTVHRNGSGDAWLVVTIPVRYRRRAR